MKFKISLDDQQLEFEAKDARDAINLVAENMEIIDEEEATEARSKGTKEKELVELMEGLGASTKDLREAKTLDEQLDQELNKLFKK